MSAEGSAGEQQDLSTIQKKSSIISKQFVQNLLAKHGHLLNWITDGKENILDVGCGDGITTFYALYPYVAKYTEQLHVADISEELLKIAEECCNIENVSFVKMDTSSPRLNPNLHEKFHKVFSFFCVHTIPYPRKWLKNFYKMLKPGGQMFVTATTFNPSHEVVLALSELDKWRRYLHPVHTTQYIDKVDPIAWLTPDVSDGFEIQFFENLSDAYTFESYDAFKAFVTAAPCITEKIPEELRSQYIEDFMEEFCKGARDPNDPNKYALKSSFIFLLASKRTDREPSLLTP